MGITCDIRSFATELRNECYDTFPHVNWYRKPTPEHHRKMLQAWGQVRREQDPLYWIKLLNKKIQNNQSDILFIDDLRYRNEAQWLRDNTECVLGRLSIVGQTNDDDDDSSEKDLDDWRDWDFQWAFPYGNLILFPSMLYQIIRFYPQVVNALGGVHGRTT
jgi:hypothetical protein